VGIVTPQAAELPPWQRILPGTTAWRMSVGRRQVVESVNAALKGRLRRPGSRLPARDGADHATTVLLDFTLAPFNLNRIRSYRSKLRVHADEEQEVDGHLVAPMPDTG
jgi:hypothetical protein